MTCSDTSPVCENSTPLAKVIFVYCTARAIRFFDSFPDSHSCETKCILVKYFYYKFMFYLYRDSVCYIGFSFVISAYLREVDQHQEALRNDTDPIVKRRALLRVQQALIAAQELGDEKLQIVQQVQDLIENKSRQLDLDYRNLGVYFCHTSIFFICLNSFQRRYIIFIFTVCASQISGKNKRTPNLSASPTRTAIPLTRATRTTRSASRNVPGERELRRL